MDRADIGKAKKLEMAFDITGRKTGATSAEFTDSIMGWIIDPKLSETWNAYVKT